ncbi:hypothetical protein JCM11491_004289 [Sporobolomyces phaffii]
MLCKLLVTVSAALYAASVFAAPLERRNPGSAVCMPFNLTKHEKVMISTNSSHTSSWVRHEDVVTSFYVGTTHKPNSTNTFGISSLQANDTEYFKFETRKLNETQYCISDFSGGYDVRDAPCSSELTDWKLTCRSCGYSGVAAVCQIASRTHGTCATVAEPLRVQYGPDGLIDLEPCGSLGVEDGSTAPGNQIWYIKPVRR